MNHDYIKDLELLLAGQLRKPEKGGNSAYICSPLRSETRIGTAINMQAAKAYLSHVIDNMGYAAKAPHAYLPTMLNDDVPEERALALRLGLRVLENCNAMFVCGNRLSMGMLGEIAFASGRDIKIHVFNKAIYTQVMQVVVNNGGAAERVILNESQPMLALSPEELAISAYAGRLFDAEVLRCFVNSNV